MEFSRPEYWSGKPFPSPGDLPNPGIKPKSPALQGDSLPAEPQGEPKNTGVGSLSLLHGGLPNPGIKSKSPALQADSLPAKPLGKPKNTGVGSLSLLQGIFPTQGLNPGLPQCRGTPYQLSHQGSPQHLLIWLCWVVFAAGGLFCTVLRGLLIPVSFVAEHRL